MALVEQRPKYLYCFLFASPSFCIAMCTCYQVLITRDNLNQCHKYCVCVCVCHSEAVCAKDLQAIACGQSLPLLLEVKILLKFTPVYQNKLSIFYIRTQNNAVIWSAVTRFSYVRKNINDRQKEPYVTDNVGRKIYNLIQRNCYNFQYSDMAATRVFSFRLHFGNCSATAVRLLIYFFGYR